jgi:hypothetical protein
MKIWILLLIAGLLLLWSLYRERFEATPSIQGPPYSDDEKARIAGMLSSADMSLLQQKVNVTTPTVPTGDTIELETDSIDERRRKRALAAEKRTKQQERDKAIQVAVGGLLTPVIGDFFTTVYRPATTLLTQADIDGFLTARTTASDIREIENRVLKVYFIDQSGVGTSGTSGYAEELAKQGQGQGYMYNCPTGATGPQCQPARRGTTSGTAATGTTRTMDEEVDRTTTGTTAGGTTGGSSDSSAAPNAGPVGANTGRGQGIFGPVFTELGSPVDGADGRDSSKTNTYPELLGGMGDTTSVRTSSGIRNPSQNWLLSQSGALPSTASLGSGANSMFLPYSRTPGDQDLIPDPYRLSRNYSTASYSSKTDPVPFLTDFSAFFK